MIIEQGIWNGEVNFRNLVFYGHYSILIIFLNLITLPQEESNLEVRG